MNTGPGKTIVSFDHAAKEPPNTPLHPGPFLVRRYQLDNDQKGRKCHAEIRYVRLPVNKEGQQIRIEHCLYVDGLVGVQALQVIHMKEVDLVKILNMYRTHPVGR